MVRFIHHLFTKHKISKTKVPGILLLPVCLLSGFPEINHVILNAMKNYGIILTDIGSDIFISLAPDERWNNDDLNILKQVKASDFEVIRMGEIMTD